MLKIAIIGKLLPNLFITFKEKNLFKLSHQIVTCFTENIFRELGEFSMRKDVSPFSKQVPGNADFYTGHWGLKVNKIPCP